MQTRLMMVATIIVAALAVMACSSPGAATVSPAASVAASAEASTAPSEAASSEPSAAASEAAEATVEMDNLGTFGPGLYAGDNEMTVYTFTKDVKDSGKSACTGGCISTWPALTVAAGETPTAGEGVTGKLGTITREDDGTLQVTYNGLPLYFFKNDKAKGDTNGIYENWNAVKP